MADNEEFFPARPETRPMIYAYEEDNPKYAGMLKVGFASTGVEKRVAEQFPVLKPGDRKPYRIVFAESAMYSDGVSFTDKRVHEKLVAMGYEQQYHQGRKTEWFKCTENAVRATRIPVFMYLSDYREYSLDDVITKLEPNLFRKVTGLSVKDFNLLCSLNVFNASLMNDAVYKFKRYMAAVNQGAGDFICRVTR